MLQQRSSAWDKIRKAKITASRFGDVLAAPTTKRYKNYMQEIIDSIMGVPNFDDDEKPWFSHGIAWEDQARAEYEWQTNLEVEKSFFDVHPKYHYIGCSTDGSINKSGLLSSSPYGVIEIKSRKTRKAFDENKGKLPASYKPQVYGELWITEANFCDFINFFKDEETNETDIDIFRVEPNYAYFEKLEKACLDFWKNILTRLPNHIADRLI